jgi:RES domain-containing protein
MPPGQPPREPARPRIHALPAGSLLWRLERPRRNGERPLFRDRPAGIDEDGLMQGRRWDPSQTVRYGYCYAALDDLTAICETLLRDIPYDGPTRYLPLGAIRNRSLVALETTRPLALISLLEAADLAAVRQDTWIVHAEPREYWVTQLWAHWLREATLDDGTRPDGLIWPSKRQPTGRAVMLFEDRARDAVLRSPLGERPLEVEGLSWLNARLQLLNTRVAT